MPAILGTILSALGSTLMSMLMKLVAGPALEKLIIEALELLVESTESTADDRLLKVVKDGLKRPE